jgi:hypothetical protein
LLGLGAAALATSLTGARRAAATRARLAVKAVWLRFELADDKAAVAQAFAAAEAELQAVGRGACTRVTLACVRRSSLCAAFASL